jgi:hypothetical protein
MLQLPKQLLICGKTCDVSYSSEQGGGSTDLATGAIIIGAGITSEALEVLIHEVAEYILYCQGHRFTRYEEGNDGIRFVMSHHDFENYIREFTFVLEQIMGIKRIKSKPTGKKK